VDEALRQQVGKLFHERWARLGLERLLPEERDHVLLWSLHAECTSGGLEQFLYNSAGDHAGETVAALERHGMGRTGEVLRFALELLPGGWCAERNERCRRLENVREEDLRALDREYDASIASEPRNDSLGESIVAAYRREGLLGGPGPAPDGGDLSIS
jgi:hypothetical protein